MSWTLESWTLDELKPLDLWMSRRRALRIGWLIVRYPLLVVAELGALVAPVAVAILLLRVITWSLGLLGIPSWLGYPATATLFAAAIVISIWVFVKGLRGRVILVDAPLFVLSNLLAIAAVWFFASIGLP